MSARQSPGAAAPGEADRERHRRFLNRYYGEVRHLYDLTRRYYLFGRDRALAGLLDERWSSLVEIGPGTGRNLRHLHRARPAARLGGIEASDVMLAHARSRCPFAELRQGFAEDEDAPYELLGAPPDRILFSYCLSMVQDPARALDRALRALSPGGEVVIVDFSDCAGLPAPLRAGFLAFLRGFHVSPLDEGLLRDRGAGLRHGPLRYYQIARLRGATRP